jgi:hypothetical protein
MSFGPGQTSLSLSLPLSLLMPLVLSDSGLRCINNADSLKESQTHCLPMHKMSMGNILGGGDTKKEVEKTAG